MTLTPEQFNKLATKEDLEKFVTKDEFNEKMNLLLTAIDGLAKIVTDFQAEMASHWAIQERLRH